MTVTVGGRGTAAPPHEPSLTAGPGPAGRAGCEGSEA